jgi:hypothetical protein
MPNPLLNRPPKIHDIKALNCAKHTVYNHAETIQKIRHETIEPLAIRTPFHAQKTMLKNNTTMQDIHTIYVPTTKRTVLSLPIHANMSQATYDWIKNHKSIDQTLSHTPLDIIIDVKTMYQLTSHEDTLASTVDFYHQSDMHPHHITIDKAIDILVSACLQDSNLRLKEQLPVTTVFTNLVIPKLKTISHYLHNHAYKIACIELPLNLTKTQYHLLLQASRYSNTISITYYKPHRVYIDKLFKTLRIIDLIKVW